MCLTPLDKYSLFEENAFGGKINAHKSASDTGKGDKMECIEQNEATLRNAD
jgi:hypothetical protein